MKFPKSLLAAFTLLTLTVLNSQGQTADEQSPYEMTVEQHLSTPEIPVKYQGAITRHIEGIGNSFAKAGLKTRPARSGQVVTIIIPADMLFGANETELLDTSHRILNSFRDLVRRPELYKLLVVAYTDDTGDEPYSDNLTEVRANATSEYLESLAEPAHEPNIIPYGLGSEEPLLPNNSIANRRQNRRIEISIIPTQRLVDMAKGGRL